MLQITAFNYGLGLGVLLGSLGMFVAWVLVEYWKGTYKREKFWYDEDEVREEIRRHEKAR